MPKWPFKCALVTGAAAMAWFSLGAGSRPDENQLPPSSIGSFSRPPIAVAAVGCSAQGCHGGPIKDDVPQSIWGVNAAENDRCTCSATIWRTYDPHSRAFAVLQEERARNMENLLAKANRREPSEAVDDVRCLACHTNPRLAERMDSEARFYQTEGVACESCHGPAEKWRESHVHWDSLTDREREYAAYGMTPLFDIAVRAETCAGCHVGAPAGNGIPLRDVNHDLIAAGHPRLNFDFATYQRLLPPHWTEKDRNQPVGPARLRSASYEAQHWRVGRAVSAAAALELLADRAQRRAPWPEFAEGDCYSCHHDLLPDSWRNQVPNYYAGRKRGSLPWNEPPLLRALLNDDGNKSLQAVAQRMAAAGSPRDLPAMAKEAASQCRRQAVNWAKQPPNPQLAQKLADYLARHPPTRWDEACHAYYALLALGPAGQDKMLLIEMQSALSLPQEPKRFDSPKGYAPDRATFDFAGMLRRSGR